MWSGLKQARPAGLRMEGGGNLFYGAPPPPSEDLHPPPPNPPTHFSLVLPGTRMYTMLKRGDTPQSWQQQNREHAKTQLHWFQNRAKFQKVACCVSTDTSSRKDFQSPYKFATKFIRICVTPPFPKIHRFYPPKISEKNRNGQNFNPCTGS